MTSDPFALPCHPSLRLTPEDRDWRAIGVKSADDVICLHAPASFRAVGLHYRDFTQTTDAEVQRLLAG